MKDLQNTDVMKKGIKESWMFGAHIPDIVQIQWMKEYGITDIYSEEFWPKIKRLLNSDYKYLKPGNCRL